MQKHIGVVTLAAILCGGIQMQAAEPARSTSELAHAEGQQLLKDRNEAIPKAQAAKQKLREAGGSPESLGFESAKALRDKQAASGAKATAYDRYAKTAKKIERRIKEAVERGEQPVFATDIARFERLQAEVDLARLAGRLPAQEN